MNDILQSKREKEKRKSERVKYNGEMEAFLLLLNRKREEMACNEARPGNNNNVMRNENVRTQGKGITAKVGVTVVCSACMYARNDDEGTRNECNAMRERR